VDYNERQGEREKNIGDKFKQHFGAKEGKKRKERKKESRKSSDWRPIVFPRSIRIVAKS
jgi:hypothetical protein